MLRARPSTQGESVETEELLVPAVRLYSPYTAPLVFVSFIEINLATNPTTKLHFIDRACKSLLRSVVVQQLCLSN